MTAAAAYWPTAVRTLVRTDVRTLVRTAPPAPRPDAAPPALEAPEDLAKRILFHSSPYTQEFTPAFSLQLCSLYIRREWAGNCTLARKPHGYAERSNANKHRGAPSLERGAVSCARREIPSQPKFPSCTPALRHLGHASWRMYLLQTASARHPPCFMQAKPESARGEWKSGTFALTPFPPDGGYIDILRVDLARDRRCTTCSPPPRTIYTQLRAVPLVPTTRWSAHIKRTELKKMMGPSGRCPALSRSTPGWGRT